MAAGGKRVSPAGWVMRAVEGVLDGLGGGVSNVLVVLGSGEGIVVFDDDSGSVMWCPGWWVSCDR